MAGLRRALVAIAAGLALADASIVALALPPILTEFDTTISGVAAIIGVYALVLAVSIWPAARVRVGPWGFALFALASLGCAVAGSLELLLAFRALQAVGGAAALIAAFVVLDAGASRSGRRLWLGAALIGTAARPAIGGALTQAFDWRAIFIVPAPPALAAAVACVRRAPRPTPATPPSPNGASPAGRRAPPTPRATAASSNGASAAAPATPSPGLWSRGEDAPRAAAPPAAASPAAASPRGDGAPARAGIASPRSAASPLWLAA